MASGAGWRLVLPVFVVGKLLAVAALLGGAFAWFVPEQRWNQLAYSDQQIGLLAAFINWDGQHYLDVARQGYPWPPSYSSAFFPLLPALIWLGMQLGLHPIAAALVIVTLASALALLLFERLLPEGERSPSSLWLLACFPTAFYLSTVYADALFLAEFFGLLWALREPRRAAWALGCAALLPVTRGQGLWLFIPLGVAWLALLRWPTAPGRPARRSLAAASAGYALGVLAYCVVFWWTYGHPLAGFYVQELFVFNNSAGNLLDPMRFIEYLLRTPEHFLWPTNAVFDKLMMILSLGAMLYGMRFSRNPFLLAAWVTFAVLPALMGEGGSYGRHALLAWACFLLTAGPSLSRRAKWAILLPGFAAQLALAALFGGNHWVG